MDVRDMAFVVVLVIFRTVLSVMANTGETNFEIETQYTDVYCPGQSVMYGVSSNVLCAYKASLTEGCIGFFFNTITGVCSTATDLLDIVSSCQPQNGSVYFKKKACAIPVALVTGPHGIPDSKITSTPHFYIWHPKNGRLDDNRQWVPNEQNRQQYIQFDFRRTKSVMEIITQGSQKGINKGGKKNNAWVTSYKLHYSTDCIHFTEYNQVFNGNSNPNSHVSNDIYPVIVARCVRVNPWTWSDIIGMRIEMMGC